MVKNVGSLDRVIRFVLALVLFSLFFFLEGNARYWALTGLIPLVTGALNFCPIWAACKINTASESKEN